MNEKIDLMKKSMYSGENALVSKVLSTDVKEESRNEYEGSSNMATDVVTNKNIESNPTSQSVDYQGHAVEEKVFSSNVEEVIESSILLKVLLSDVKEDDGKSMQLNTELCVCYICGESFPDVEKFKLHVRTHKSNVEEETENSMLLKVLLGDVKEEAGNSMQLDTNLCVCNTCGESFPDIEKFKLHVKTHQSNHSFSCKTCDKTFYQASKLREHMNMHSGSKPFICDDCGKAFSFSNSLRKHKKTHSGDKPFVCDTCGKSFSFSSNLRVHMRNHTGLKPFVCETCGKAYRQNAELKRHMNVHAGLNLVFVKLVTVKIQPMKMASFIKTDMKIEPPDDIPELSQYCPHDDDWLSYEIKEESTRCDDDQERLYVQNKTVECDDKDEIIQLKFTKEKEKKTPLTSVERQRKRRERLRVEGLYKDYRKNQNEMCRKSRHIIAMKEKALPKSIHDGLVRDRKEKNHKRVAKFRAKIKNNNSSQASASIIEPFKTVSGLGKAMARAECALQNALPSSPRRKTAVMQKLYTPIPDITPSTSEQLQEHKNRISADTVAKVINFYERDDISREAPGRRNVINVCGVDGIKTPFQTRHLTSSIIETHALFCEEFPNTIGKSKFAELRPRHVLLSSKLPHNVCLCRHHDNFIVAINALHKANSSVPLYTHDLPPAFLCNLPTHDCWLNNCNACNNGKGFLKVYPFEETNGSFSGLFGKMQRMEYCQK
ncbi:Zinc finger protein 77 [Nymphon striatum]|nr:Zinc finger protein 77 [Nymphon striatum]